MLPIRIFNEQSSKLPDTVDHKKLIQQIVELFLRGQDYSGVIETLSPWVDHWIEMLTVDGSTKDINYILLYRRLRAELYIRSLGTDEDTIPWIQSWVDDVNALGGLRPELEFLVVKTIIKSKLKNKMPERIPMLFSRNFTLILKNTILLRSRIQVRKLVESRPNYKLPPPAIEDYYPDNMLIHYIKQSSWENYLWHFYSRAQSDYDVADISQLPRETFKYEGSSLWNRIFKHLRKEKTLLTRRQL